MTKRKRIIRNMQHAKAGDIRRARNYRSTPARVMVCLDRATFVLHPEWRT
ncbi:hypothetical protein ACF1DV_26060 [Streptomyces achromogenes]